MKKHSIWLTALIVISCVTSQPAAPPSSPSQHWAEINIQDLESEDATKRARAASALQGAPDEYIDRATEALTKALSDPNSTVRINATAALSRYKKKAAPAEPALRQALNDESGWVVVNSAIVLANIGVPKKELVTKLSAALKDPQWENRIRAASLLKSWQVEWEVWLPTLLNALKEAEDEDRAEALTVMARGVRNLPPSAVPPIIELLNDPSPKIRYKAILVLADGFRPSPPEGIPALIAALDDTEIGVVRVAAGTLGFHGSASIKAVPKLLRLLKPPNPCDLCRSEAICSLSRIAPDDPGVRRVLEWARNNDPAPRVREAADRALE